MRARNDPVEDRQTFTDERTMVRTMTKGTRLAYPDANATPWPLNHHAYVQACADRLRKEVPIEPQVHIPERQLRREDVRAALVRVPATEETPSVLLAWDELRGWDRLDETGRQALVLGADALISPETFTHAVTALLSPETRRTIMVFDRARARCHPTDPYFEQRLASYRRL